jgi:hypothetical protein
VTPTSRTSAASPRPRDLIFDVNDFDETLPGPFEWDLKRLAASLEIAARGRQFDEATRCSIVAQGTRSYRTATHQFAGMRDLEIWYSRMDAAAITARWGTEVGSQLAHNLERRVTKARSKDHLAALAKLTTEVDGRLTFVNNPPLMVPAEDLFTDIYSKQTVSNLSEALSQYRQSLTADRQRLLEKYEFVDLARKVVGVGSVGTRCWVALFTGRDHEDPLFLQVKEAEAAGGEPFLGVSEYPQHGQRVVEGQRLMQGASDIFLGWDQFLGEDGSSGTGRCPPTSTRWHPRCSGSTPKCAGGPSLGPTPVRATPSPWVPTWGRATDSTRRCASSRRRTPTRTSGTSRRSPGPSPTAPSRRSAVSDRSIRLPPAPAPLLH